MAGNDAPGTSLNGPRGTVGRIYKEDNYTLLRTQNMKGLGLVVSEKKIVYVFPRRIYVELLITLLHAKHTSFGSCDFMRKCLMHFPL